MGTVVVVEVGLRGGGVVVVLVVEQGEWNMVWISQGSMEGGGADQGGVEGQEVDQQEEEEEEEEKEEGWSTVSMKKGSLGEAGQRAAPARRSIRAGNTEGEGAAAAAVGASMPDLVGHDPSAGEAVGRGRHLGMGVAGEGIIRRLVGGHPGAGLRLVGVVPGVGVGAVSEAGAGGLGASKEAGAVGDLGGGREGEEVVLAAVAQQRVVWVVAAGLGGGEEGRDKVPVVGAVGWEACRRGWGVAGGEAGGEWSCIELDLGDMRVGAAGGMVVVGTKGTPLGRGGAAAMEGAGVRVGWKRGGACLVGVGGVVGVVGDSGMWLA